MTRSEFIKMTEHYHKNVGGWDIVLDNYSLADFILGCYYNESDKKWKVYQNNEQGMNWEVISTESESEAYEKLYALIKFQLKMINRG